MSPDLALAATFAFQLFLILSLMGAIYMCRVQYLDVSAELFSLRSQINQIDNSTLDPYEPFYEETYAMCGGCGLSLLAPDGFNPVEHGCSALAEHSDKTLL